jgi:hypothetical protein
MTRRGVHAARVDAPSGHETEHVLLRVRSLEAAVASFSVLIGAAMMLYPGGTWYDRTHQGHAFFENFLCDLLHVRAISGADNTVGAILATIGMVSLVPGLVCFVLLVPEVVPIGARLWRALRAVGVLACSLLVAIPLLPSDRYGILHGVAVLGAGIPATIALSTMVVKIAQIAARSWPWRLLSVALVMTMFASLGLYLRDAVLHAPSTHALPVLARFATLLLLVWLLAFARLVRKRKLG